ncbi:MAG: hypothetical protein AAB656_00485, partial [Patescibacteria group bacterium]
MKNKILTFLNRVRKIQGEALVVYGILILAAMSASIGSSYIVNKIKQSDVPTPQPQVEKPSQYPDYDAIKGKKPDGKIKVVRFTDGCLEGGCVNDIPAAKVFDGIKKNYLVKGNISRGYLYIEAAVDYGRPLTNYDDFYFTLNFLGGHLVTNEALLPVPASDISRYLFDLRNITYRNRGVKTINFLNILQHTRIVNVHTSVSSDRSGRVLKEVAFYYQCA